MMTCLIPARLAASTFSLIPPTASTRPRRLISPVIATSERTRRCVNSDASATTIVTPALGPSLGVAPAGTWVNVVFVKIRQIEFQRLGLAAQIAERGLRALL